MKKCLHCENPLLNNQINFCCDGCEAGYNIIKNSGLSNYYLNRITDSKISLKPELNQEDFVIEDYCQISNTNLKTINLVIPAINCGACVWLIENLLKRQESVVNARVNLTQKILELTWRGEFDVGKNLINLINNIGYKALPIEEGYIKEIEQKFNNQIFKALAVAGFGVGNIMLFSFALWFDSNNEISGITRQFLYILSSIIALPVIIYSGRIFFISAYRSTIKGFPNMDLAISIAIFLATIVSIIQTYRIGSDIYFDSVVMLIFFLLIGRYLDFKARKKIFNITSEFSLLQTTFGRVEIGGRVTLVPSKKLKKDMVLIVASGEKIACDGEIIEGETIINNSLISGEIIPQNVKIGEQVFGGSINNGNPIKVKITKNLNDSLLSKIIDIIAKIEFKKNTYVRIADNFSKYYTPAVHLIAFLTFIYWFFYQNDLWDVALMKATAVLIITCPCALALAIPIAQSLAIANFVKNGIIIKNGEVLEKLEKVDYVIFDKTGSITIGEPDLVGVYDITNQQFIQLNLDDLTHQKNFSIAYNIAKFSTHPIAKSLTKFLEKHVDNKDYKLKTELHQGSGISANIGVDSFYIGNKEFCNIDFKFDKIHHKQDDFQSELSCFFSSADHQYLFIFKDKIKENCHELIEFLQEQNKKIILLSGDKKIEVERIAKLTKINQYYWQKNPVEKAEIIQNLKNNGNKILMIGDGLNDAPSLALADISLSFAKAVDLSQNIADILIESDKLSAVIYLMKFSKITFKVMKQNLGIALIYNVLAVPFAIAGYIVPLLAAIAMSSSSLLVTVNSLKLNYKNKL
ncbi:MAG: heavy metal translocating P-type ATPase [Alphaproteobacteria bacterium]